MPHELPTAVDEAVWREALGYLNFSSGTPDRRFRGHLNRLFELAESTGETAWQVVGEWIEKAADRLAGSGPAFADLSAARAARRIVFEELLPAYREHHRDLLFHQTSETLFNAFFVAVSIETVLSLAPLREAETGAGSRELVAEAIRQLNDFVGHRPIAVLQSRKHQPYAHERVRPVPLYLRDSGAAAGRYRALVERALVRLQEIPADLRDTAQFDLDALEELAFDPRAYDFDHPVSKRPNYLFGQWDPDHLGGDGRYDRFVLQQATLDALLSRVEEAASEQREALLEEAAAVLAVTMLMAAMTSGRTPGAHDSTETLSTLVTKIARMRDAAYEALLAAAPAEARQRLAAEARERQQPFGGARQHLNQRLARLRAAQVQHVRLAEVYAQLGAARLAQRHVDAVPAASARMAAEIRCRAAVAERWMNQGQFREALAEIEAAESCLLRAIDCGALVDPWNILGFQGQFSLFRAVENSMVDHRVDLLIDRVELIFSGLRRLAALAAADGDDALAAEAHRRFRRAADWWDQFAATTVDSVRPLSGREAYESSLHVAESLAAWHRGGTSAGDLAFWRDHVERFDSARAYAQVVDALLEHGDLVAAQALLIQWLAQSHRVKLQEGDDSFHRLVAEWLRLAIDQPWARWKRMVDLLEANAENGWEAPRLEIGESKRPKATRQGEPEADAEEQELYSAAYDEMTFRDSTADGIDADMLEEGLAPASDFELEQESRRLAARVALLATAAQVWQACAARAVRPDEADAAERADREASLSAWAHSAERLRAGLAQLLDEVHEFHVPDPQPSHESHLEYDRRRRIKDSLTERVVTAQIATCDAVRMLRAAGGAVAAPSEEPFERHAHAALAAIARRDSAGVRAALPGLLAALAEERILIVPLGKGGDPRQVVAAKGVQHLCTQLARDLPRLGLLAETCQVLKTAQAMERNRPAGARPVSEFDLLFREGLTSLVGALSAATLDDGEPRDAELLQWLRQWTRSLMRLWLRHSQSLRLSVLERIRDERHWRAISRFIARYGEELFTQRFLNLGNLRAILDVGCERYLRGLVEQSPEGAPKKLLADLGSGTLKYPEAAAHLDLVIEAVVENHEEYIDYNTTTVQSDRGDKLGILLDFLRLKAGYHRVAWNIRPLVWVHDELVRLGRVHASELWRRSIVDQTSQVADWHLKQLADLRAQYAVELASVGDRLAERFVQPLALARLRALVGPAAAELRAGDEGDACEDLERDVADLLAVPSGVRMGEPDWLEALEEEVERSAQAPWPAALGAPPAATPPLPLSAEEIDDQWHRWEAEAG